MKKEAGLTLFEIMIVIIIIFIISATSLPIISRTVGIFRVKSGAETLGTRLNMARQESVRRSKPTVVFFDQANSRMYVDLNHNGVPEGSKNADVQSGKAFNEEYTLPSGVGLQIRSSASTCFDVVSSGFNKPPEISNYTDWKYLVYDSRGELQTKFRTDYNACMQVNMDSAQSDPTGAVLIYCTLGSSGATRYTVSVSLRGGTSVLTYRRLPDF